MLPHRDSESLLVGEVDDAVQRREVVVVRPAPQHITTVDEDGTRQDRGAVPLPRRRTELDALLIALRNERENGAVGVRHETNALAITRRIA